jgi:CelD/BcsL family acetyltransferase involved in cellulose biosynthesis
MTVYEIDPTRDERWDELLENHPNASVFQTRGWLEALHLTYGYQPVAFTFCAPGHPLTNAVPFCQISGWLNSQRLVSLPFSDHSMPLVEHSGQLASLLSCLREKLRRRKWSYIEIRPAELINGDCEGFGESQVFCLHKIDLRPDLNDIFRKLHKDCVQRKIRRAVREGLTCEEGRSDSLVDKFYQLLLLTRRTQGLPVQPAEWFRNLVTCVGDKAKIRVASKNGRPIASILTLRHKRVLVYKYGCSDRGFNNMGGTQLLLWNAIQEARREGLCEFDLGRSDVDNPGLLMFKDRWGAVRTPLTYLRYPLRGSFHISKSKTAGIGKYVWSHVPSSVLAAAGRMLYKYMG